jgi:hypothetical protein
MKIFVLEWRIYALMRMGLTEEVGQFHYSRVYSVLLS